MKPFGVHVNSQGECIEIAEVASGGFRGLRVLILHDDSTPLGSGIQVPMLLDDCTVSWLLGKLTP
jgi:hypothetical protein